MLKGKKISYYKTKKILKCFIKDLSIVDATDITKMNRNTIGRYYNFFRTILSDSYNVFFDKKEKKCSNCLGVYKSQYIEDYWVKVYRFNDKIFLRLCSDKPGCSRDATQNEDFRSFLDYFYTRVSKFYGFNNKKSYCYQVIESIFRYYYSEDKLFTFIWKNLLKNNIISTKTILEEACSSTC